MRKTVLVTGASGGIGQAAAQRLAADGFHVVVQYSAGEEAARSVLDKIQSVGGAGSIAQADMRQDASVSALFASAAKIGKLYGVVHAAGIHKTGLIADGDVEAFDQVHAINLRGTFLVLGHAAKSVMDGGRIVALSSSVISKATAGYGAYISSKAGVEGLVRVLAQEVRGRNITVNAVAPGPVRTPLFVNGKTDEQVRALAMATPMERLGEPEDIAHVVSFLLGPDGGWVHGQVLRANGGFA